jgi:hypothetical protein
MRQLGSEIGDGARNTNRFGRKQKETGRNAYKPAPVRNIPP